MSEADRIADWLVGMASDADSEAEEDLIVNLAEMIRNREFVPRPKRYVSESALFFAKAEAHKASDR